MLRSITTILALAGIIATPAPANAPVTYLVVGYSTGELRRVVGERIDKRYPLGTHNVFGVAERRLATLWERHLTLFDLSTGAVVSELMLPPGHGPRGWMSGIEQDLVLKPKEGAVYYMTDPTSAEFLGYTLERFELETGKLSSFRTEVGGRLFDVPDGVGLCGLSHGSILVFKDGQFRTLRQREDPPSVSDPNFVASCVHLAGVGILRVTQSGRLEIFDSSRRDPGPVSALNLASTVAKPQAAMLEGKPVLAYGETVRGAHGTEAVSALVIYDPLAGRPLWRRKLPWLARTFSVSSENANLFRIIPHVSLQLTHYDRTTDAFTKSVVLNSTEIEKLAIIPSP